MVGSIGDVVGEDMEASLRQAVKKDDHWKPGQSKYPMEMKREIVQIYRNGGITQYELAQRYGIPKGNISVFIKQVEKEERKLAAEQNRVVLEREADGRNYTEATKRALVKEWHEIGGTAQDMHKKYGLANGSMQNFEKQINRIDTGEPARRGPGRPPGSTKAAMRERELHESTEQQENLDLANGRQERQQMEPARKPPEQDNQQIMMIVAQLKAENDKLRKQRDAYKLALTGIIGDDDD